VLVDYGTGYRYFGMKTKEGAGVKKEGESASDDSEESDEGAAPRGAAAATAPASKRNKPKGR
jgi:hypothetical protein